MYLHKFKSAKTCGDSDTPVTLYPLSTAVVLRWLTLIITGVASLFSVGVAQAYSGLPDFTELVSSNHQAVVNISTTSKRASGDGGAPVLPDLGDSPLEELLKKYWEENGPESSPLPGRPEENSLGSGFIISADGYVLTNNHVLRFTCGINR